MQLHPHRTTRHRSAPLLLALLLALLASTLLAIPRPSAAATTPSGNSLGAPTALSVTITDAPAGGLLASAQSLSLAEGGPSASYTLALDRAPASDVTVTLSAGAQLSLGATTLTFTPAN